MYVRIRSGADKIGAGAPIVKEINEFIKDDWTSQLDW
jgi:hypothetical protein